MAHPTNIKTRRKRLFVFGLGWFGNCSQRKNKCFILSTLRYVLKHFWENNMLRTKNDKLMIFTLSYRIVATRFCDWKIVVKLSISDNFIALNFCFYTPKMYNIKCRESWKLMSSIISLWSERAPMPRCSWFQGRLITKFSP